MWSGEFSPCGTSRQPDSAGPSWLTVLGHAKDSLWSLDLFRCESAILRTHWVLVVMDQCTRRIVGFGVQRGVVDGVGLCRMFNRATRGHIPPTYLSSDHDPLYRFHQWKTNLRILNVKEIKTVPYVPLSHPFVERLIGTIRRECLDRVLFWTAADLEMKLLDFQRYYNRHRAHAGLDGRTPEPARAPAAHGRASAIVQMAAALSWTVSNAKSGMTGLSVGNGASPTCLVLNARTLPACSVPVIWRHQDSVESPHCMFVRGTFATHWEFARDSLGITVSATTVRTWLQAEGLEPVGTRRG